MNLLKNAWESPTVYRLGWAMLHFLWEGALVAVVLAALLKALRPRSAQARYIACSIGLLMLALLPVVTFLITPAGSALPVVGSRVRVIIAQPAFDSAKTSPDRGANGPTEGFTAARTRIEGIVKSQPDAPSPAHFVPSPPQLAATAPLSRAFRQTLDFLPRILPWLVLAWCAGALALSVYNLGGWIAVRRLRLLATGPVAADLTDAAIRLARGMGISRKLRLLQSALIDSPMVIGALKPVILLPTSLLTGLSPAQIESLLAHEFAHVRRHDYLINLLQGVIETLLFYHPAVWWVSRRIRIERELCCDDRVIAITQDRSAYVSALAAVAECGRKEGRELLFSRSKGTGAFAVAARGGALVSRVRRLLGLPDADAARSPRWLAGGVALALCVIGAGAIITRAADKPVEAAKDKDFDAPKTWVLDLVVADKALGEPIPKMTLAVRVDKRQLAFTTDDQGRAHIEYPQDVKYLSIAPKSDIYVPVILSWNNESTAKTDHIPDTYKLELDHGTTIGGVINDETGKGIPNVAIELTAPIRGGNASRVSLYLNSYPLKTDAEGQWRCDVIPKDWEQPYIRLRHPDFVSDDNFRSKGVPAMEKLRDRTSVMVMSKGIQISGRVLDQAGKPIEKADVVLGRKGYDLHPPQSKTDKDGFFRLTHCRPSQQSPLMVTAKERAPFMKAINSDKDVEDLEIKMDPGNVLRVRIVNMTGEPLAGATMATWRWRGIETLNLRMQADNDGRIVWNEAPADGVSYNIWQGGYVQLSKALSANGQEQVVTLVPQLKVSGSVVDADSGKAIEKFRVVHGWTSNGNRREEPHWNRDQITTGENGKFEYIEDYDRDGYAARVEAEGYLPAESRVFKAGEGTIALEFKLKQGKPMVGMLQTPDGKPLAGADLLVVSGSSQIFIRNGAVAPGTYTLQIKADDAGRFNLPPQAGKFTVLVIHSAGYAELTPEQLAEDRVIPIKPWGRVEGSVWVGAKPGANLTVAAMRSRSGERNVNFETKATADEKGHFVLDRVVPGTAQIGIEMSRPYRGGMTSVSWTQTQKIEVESGKTFQAVIGGKGRAVIGQVVPPAELADIDWTNVDANISSRVTVVRKLPADWATMDAAAKRKANEEWSKSADGQEATRQRENSRYYSLHVQPGGSLRLEDVPTGAYMLTVRIERIPDVVKRVVEGPIAIANVEFTILEMPNGRSDEPLDLGKIELKMTPAPKR